MNSQRNLKKNSKNLRNPKSNPNPSKPLKNLNFQIVIKNASYAWINLKIPFLIHADTNFAMIAQLIFKKD